MKLSLKQLIAAAEAGALADRGWPGSSPGHDRRGAENPAFSVIAGLDPAIHSGRSQFGGLDGERMKYRVMIDVTNIHLADGKFGAMTTRFVAASDSASASQIAIQEAQAELAARTSNAPSDPPIFEVEELETLDDAELVAPPSGGFAFYRQ